MQKQTPTPLQIPTLAEMLGTTEPQAAFAAALTLIAGACKTNPNVAVLLLKAFIMQLTELQLRLEEGKGGGL